MLAVGVALMVTACASVSPKGAATPVVASIPGTPGPTSNPVAAGPAGSGEPTPTSWVAPGPDGIALLQWTADTGGSVSGTYILSGALSSAAGHLTGSVSNGSASLVLAPPAPIAALTGTIIGGRMLLSYTEQSGSLGLLVFLPGTGSDYTAALQTSELPQSVMGWSCGVAKGTILVVAGGVGPGDNGVTCIGAADALGDGWAPASPTTTGKVHVCSPGPIGDWGVDVYDTRQSAAAQSACQQLQSSAGVGGTLAGGAFPYTTEVRAANLPPSVESWGCGIVDATTVVGLTGTGPGDAGEMRCVATANALGDGWTLASRGTADLVHVCSGVRADWGFAVYDTRQSVAAQSACQRLGTIPGA